MSANKEEMVKYVSHKTVEAKPMSNNEFNEYIKNGKVNDIEEDGYMVRYKDGYESWSPKKAFDEGYTELTEDTSYTVEEAKHEFWNKVYPAMFDCMNNLKEANKLMVNGSTVDEFIAKIMK